VQAQSRFRTQLCQGIIERCLNVRGATLEVKVVPLSFSRERDFLLILNEAFSYLYGKLRIRKRFFFLG
jgi:hypothetical protein